jgi:hypothetical protein
VTPTALPLLRQIVGVPLKVTSASPPLFVA